jgi:hypothetical protein
VNRPINFPVIVFLSLLALLFLLKGSAIISRLSQPTLKSEQTTGPTAVEKASLVRANIGAMFPDPVQIKVPADDRFIDSSVGAPAHEITPESDAAPVQPKEHVDLPVIVNTVLRSRIPANPVTRTHSRREPFYQPGLTHKIDTFVSYRQSVSGTGLFVPKEAFAARTNGRSTKKIAAMYERLKDGSSISFVLCGPGRKLGTNQSASSCSAMQSTAPVSPQE